LFSILNILKDEKLEKEIVIIDGARTAIGKFNGSLKDFGATDLAAIVIKGLLDKTSIDKASVDEVILGCVGQASENAYISRVAALNAGLPAEVTAQTVNRLCASGLQAISTAAMQIESGFADIVIAGGAESMTNLPFYLRNARFGYKMGHGKLEDGLITALSDPFSQNHMGITAENIAEKYKISRNEQDQYAAKSQQKAAAAIKKGYFKDEIIPVSIKIKNKEDINFDTDEHPRQEVTLEDLAKLKPAFKEGGTVTAGNSSGINDGAAALLVMERKNALRMGLKPKLKIIDSAAAGVPPEIMGTGPIPAIKKLLNKTKLNINDIGLIELNEAFAVQAIACIRELGLDEKRVNVDGGAIALGHPIGATGAYITVKLLNEMCRENIRYGIVALCIGGGQGLATLFELVN